MVIMTKPRHLRKPTARINSEFVPFVPHTGTHAEEGARNRTSSWLVPAPPSTVRCQPKSRRQAYRNSSWTRKPRLATCQPKSRRQAYRNSASLSLAIRRRQWCQPKSRRQAYRNSTMPSNRCMLRSSANRSHAARRIETYGYRREVGGAGLGANRSHAARRIETYIFDPVREGQVLTEATPPGV